MIFIKESYNVTDLDDNLVGIIEYSSDTAAPKFVFKQCFLDYELDEAALQGITNKVRQLNSRLVPF